MITIIIKSTRGYNFSRIALHLWVRSLSRAFAWYRCFVDSSFLRAAMLLFSNIVQWLRFRNNAFADHSRWYRLRQWAADSQPLPVPPEYGVSSSLLSFLPYSFLLFLFPSTESDTHVSHTCMESGTEKGLPLSPLLDSFLFPLPFLYLFIQSLLHHVENAAKKAKRDDESIVVTNIVSQKVNSLLISEERQSEPWVCKQMLSPLWSTITSLAVNIRILIFTSLITY